MTVPLWITWSPQLGCLMVKAISMNTSVVTKIILEQRPDQTAVDQKSAVKKAAAKAEANAAPAKKSQTQL